MSNASDANPSPRPRRPGLPARLLLVFEDAPFLHALSQFLTHDGFHVDAAHPSQALARLAAAPCQLLLADVDSGFHLLRRIRPGMPVLIIAAYDMLPNARQAVQLGAFAFLIKPIIDDELRQMIHGALHTPHLPAAARWHAGSPAASSDRWSRRRETARLRRPPARA